MTYPGARYLSRLLVLIGGSLCLLAAFNGVIDPYASWGQFSDGTFSRYAAGRGTRIGKAEMIARRDWDVLLLGTSRVQMGLDPSHPAFAGLRVYNAGLYGADFPELDRAARAAIKRGTLHRLILCLDLYSFDPDWQPLPEVRQSLLAPSINPIDYHLANLLSLNATQRSIETIGNALRHRNDSSYPLGLLTREVTDRHHGRSDWVLGGFFNLTIPQGAEESDQWRLNPSSLDALARLLVDASRAGVKVDVVQLPMHAICLERYFAEDRWPLYEQWLRTLTQIVSRHNHVFPASPIALWDFCPYNTFDTDPAFNKSIWFYDPFHFRPRLGNLVIDRILNVSPPAGTDLDDFGIILTEANLPGHLAQLRHDHEVYFTENPEVQEIHRAIRTDLHGGGVRIREPANVSPNLQN